MATTYHPVGDATEEERKDEIERRLGEDLGQEVGGQAVGTRVPLLVQHCPLSGDCREHCVSQVRVREKEISQVNTYKPTWS